MAFHPVFELRQILLDGGVSVYDNSTQNAARMHDLLSSPLW